MATEQISSDAQQTGKVRIFVGGVSESVNKDDLEKIFTQKSLGKVEHVDFVRTKGRSFAYVDFLPNDDYSLSKLLSMYNGCVWKGGKLKLERAKEHYLSRLKRGWSEDAESESSNLDDLGEDNVSSELVNKASDTKQLHIFFPRLRKVKSVPFNGTGKHKYSFQRVDVPALPVHFCDCEEHNPPEPLKKISASAHVDVNKCFDDYEEDQGGGMNDDELNIMTSVLNKLMQRGSNLNAKKSRTELTKSGCDSKKPENDGDNSNKLIYGIQSNDNVADSEGDEDNLVINITKREDNMPTFKRGRERKQISANKRPRSDWMQSSENGQQQDCSKAKRSDTSSKPQTRVTDGKEDKSEVPSSCAGGKETLRTGSAASIPLSIGIDSTQPDKQSTTGLSWSQKSSWKKLVGTKSMGFNISQVLTEKVLPKKASSKEYQPHLNTSTASISTDIEADKDFPSEEEDYPSEEENYLTEDNLVENQSSKIKEPESLIENQIKESDNIVQNEIKESDELVEHQNTESNRLVEPLREESNELVDTLSMKSAAFSEKSGRGTSWRQKSSWTQLINQDSGLFSISQIVPLTNFVKQGQPECRNTDMTESELEENSGLIKQDHSNIVSGDAKNFGQLMEETPEFKDAEHGSAATDSQMTPGQVDERKSSPPTYARKSGAPAKKITLRNVEIGETCTFMRSAASLKEWAKSKAALSGSRKKKKSTEN